MNNENWEELEARAVLVVKSNSKRDRSTTRETFYDRRENRSQSRSSKEVECFYCHEKWHIKRNCEELTKHLEEKRTQKAKETKAANVIGDEFDSEDEIYFVVADGENSNSWILDSGCSFHTYLHKEWFDFYEPYDVGTLLMADAKAIRIGTMKVKMFDGVMRTLTNVKHVP